MGCKGWFRRHTWGDWKVVDTFDILSHQKLVDSTTGSTVTEVGPYRAGSGLVQERECLICKMKQLRKETVR